MELLDVVDQDNQLTGKVEEKDTIHKKELWHREVAVWIMNENGEILLQKRANTKKQAPNLWALTAGHVDAKEDILDAVQREMEEELGVLEEKDRFDFLFIDNNKDEQNYRFNYHYFLQTNCKLEEFTIQLKELSEIAFITIEELEDIVKRKDEQYVFSEKEYIKRIIPILKKRREQVCEKK